MVLPTDTDAYVPDLTLQTLYEHWYYDLQQSPSTSYNIYSVNTLISVHISYSCYVLPSQNSTILLTVSSSKYSLNNSRPSSDLTARLNSRHDGNRSVSILLSSADNK